jgi:hypothetical protein
VIRAGRSQWFRVEQGNEQNSTDLEKKEGKNDCQKEAVDR